jgi:hypothetical protein
MTISLGGRPVPGFGVGSVGVGALERRNPLPPGRYWIDLFEKDSAAWLAWRARNGVKIEVTEHFNSSPPRDFIIFRTDTPVPWEGPGYPTIAGATVKASEDTGQRPPPTKDPIDAITDIVTSPTAKVVGTALGIVAGGALIIYIIANATDQRSVFA